MNFRKINNWLHLWLGLGSGIIVFIVCITACIWVFNEEITAVLEPETKIEKENRPVITPSQLHESIATLHPGKEITYANYQQGRTIQAGVGDWEGEHYTINVHPYTGKVINQHVHQKDESDFFRTVLNGHRFLWLPWEIGRPIVNYATLIFVIELITGLVWWYPKKWNKSTIEKSFTIKWGASFKRVNLDLHNVLGFYSLLFLLAIALTGMVWGIKWYSEGLYWVTSGGDTLPEFARNHSDTLQSNRFYTREQAMNKAWGIVQKKHPEAHGFYYNFPEKKDLKSPIYITIYPSAGQFYNHQSYSFDQHTLKPFAENAVYDVPYAQASFGAKLRRMNYDIHVGSILGLPGKVMAFFASLIGASLPITGFLIWWGRRNKKKTAPCPKNVTEGRHSVVNRSIKIPLTAEEQDNTPEYGSTVSSKSARPTFVRKIKPQ
ncbi:PepSY domain-containing protein [Siphonobacter sp. SORGH_AS_1065]|uniref:PepSY-associated TM helix domain-containing protein n=1 Tax=Siphonobacter sp. SORGH_AS_1065 TaxID=3041795 RepID=UPI002781B027|nr:PepSY-associated TM helix domain-containing protein [Siphonobacter sp. SORGH_AS_1065]MDQ1089185.1 putative iron-regulated membrane protein [Siphonobacter sp. SORGH_AS_1065]